MILIWFLFVFKLDENVNPFAPRSIFLAAGIFNRYSHHIQNFVLIILYWNIVHVQCCVSFWCIAKWLSWFSWYIHICIYIYIYTFLYSFPLWFILVFSSVQSPSYVRLFATLWTATCQASLSTINSQSLFKLISIESVMPSTHLIFCHPFFSCLQSFPVSHPYMTTGKP